MRLGKLFSSLLFFGILANSAFAAGEFATEVAVDPGRALGPANPLILGNNLQWVDRGDEMFRRDRKGPAGIMVERAAAMGVSILRYPGGSLSDLYHWRDGIGDAHQRGENEHFYSGRKQAVEVGTQEFLELCEALGAQPLITVNAGSGTAEEAAEWVRLVNAGGLRSGATGKLLPRVQYWEIGNEPYLKDDKQKKLWMTPQAYAAKANQFIEAMRKVDPKIQIAIPLRSDRIGDLPATPLPGFNENVLREIKGRFEFVALHNAYLPMAIDARYSDDDLYWATVAASRVVEADFAETRRMLARLQPDRRIRLAVTEYNAFFGIGTASEAYINSPAGALYVADLLRLFAYTPDLAFANYWSLSGNWHFGALSQTGDPRPAHRVLRAYREVLRGSLLPVSVKTATVDTPRVGYVPAQRGVPKVKALATLDGGVVRLILINHDLHEATGVAIAFGDARAWSRGRVTTLAARGRFDTRDGQPRFQERTEEVAAGSGMFRLQVPAVGLAVVELESLVKADGRKQAPR